MIAPEGYELGDALSRDKTGVLYRAVQTRLRRPVTLKILREEFADRPAAREVFLEERELITGLEHPNLLLTIDVGERDGLLWFATESTLEPLLSDALGEAEPMEELRAVHIALGIARALHYLATRGLVYKNVRPQNVLLPRPSAPKLITFRYVRRVTEAPTFQGANVQSGHYCAPELTRTDLGPPDGRANVYALGAILYRLLSGCLPVEGDSAEARAAHAAGDVIPLKERRPYLRDRAYAVVGSLMAHRPQDRADPAAAAGLLEEYALDPLVAHPPQSRKRRPRGRRRR